MKPSNLTSGTLSFPSGPYAFDMLKVYNIITTAMKIELSAKYIPGQMLRDDTSVLSSDVRICEHDKKHTGDRIRTQWQDQSPW